MIFEQILVMGGGEIACDCIAEIIRMNASCMAVEADPSPFSFLREKTRKFGVDHILMSSRRELNDLLGRIEKDTLIVSANNNFIFPPEIVAKRNFKIINFHNALLPRHKGRNAPTWTIYEMDREAGITWHVIDEGIDTGDIFAQHSFPTGERMTALELTRRCMYQGARYFAEHLPQILHWSIKPTPQISIQENESLHRSSDIPNNGVLDLDWSAKTISAFLRSMDYGCLSVFPEPRILEGSSEYVIKGYRISEATSGSGKTVLRKGNFFVVREEGLDIAVEVERK